MLRSAAGRLFGSIRSMASPTARLGQVRAMSGHVESDADLDARYENWFNRQDIDGWEIRKGMNDLASRDLIPEPTIIIAALKACRRVNDYALAVRWIEFIRMKGNFGNKEIYPWIIQEIRCTLEELGIETPEQLGYDKPELALVDVDEIH